MKWHRYTPHPETAMFTETLVVVDQNANWCFFG
jgi:hypothetical protein